MATKRKPSTGRTGKAAGKRPTELHPSLADGPTPAARRKALEERMRQRGLKPIEDFDRYLEEVGDFWPEEESCDEFLAWLRRAAPGAWSFPPRKGTGHEI